MILPMAFENINNCDSQTYIPKGLLLQWHVTERCNLHCSHCYQEGHDKKELPFDSLLEILRQYKKLLGLWREKGNKPKFRGHITVTGGEPFVRDDFLKLLEIFASNREYFSFAILTNGSFIDKAMAKYLRKLSPCFLQVSIEGTEIAHDNIRGNGSFIRAVLALKHLVKAGIRTFISFTAHKANFREFKEAAKLGRQLGVSRVWADRLIPQGNGANLKELLLTPEETQKFFMIMQQARIDAARSWFNKTDVSMHRALQFLIAGERPYHCTAGDTLITVQPNADLYPCRRMPICVGNLLETPLAELYYKSALFHNLRDKEQVSEGCNDCSYSKVCRGGLKCLSYAVTGNPFKADPGCWLAISNGRCKKVA